MVLTEGWDQPDVGAIVLARPTKALGLYLQMVGRVLRPAPDKTDALVLDHGGLTFLHGFAEDEVDWSLHKDKRAQNNSPGSSAGANGRTLTSCPECAAIRWEGSPCSACGWRPRIKAKPITIAEGELVQLRHDGGRGVSNIDPLEFYQQLRWIGAERGWKPGAAACQYKDKLGRWPPRQWKLYPPKKPAPAVQAWVKSRMIAYAKARAA